MKSDRLRKDVKKNCAFHKDIRHNTERCVTFRDEIERLMRAKHFNEFIDKPQTANREEQTRQQSLNKIREVLTIIDGFHLAGESCSAHDKYTKEAKTPPQIHVHRTKERTAKHVRRELEDIVFTEVDARWVHHPHPNALVSIARVANSNVHRLMVDDGSAMDIFYLDAYKRMGLAESTLSPTTSPLYGFTGDNMIPKGTAKLAMTVGEHP